MTTEPNELIQEARRIRNDSVPVAKEVAAALFKALRKHYDGRSLSTAEVTTPLIILLVDLMSQFADSPDSGLGGQARIALEFALDAERLFRQEAKAETPQPTGPVQ